MIAIAVMMPPAAEGNTGGNCAGNRKSEICGATDTHNPFADLCSEDSTNTANRVEFCKLPTKMGVGDCSDDRAVLCTARPFATNLGVGQNINCTIDDNDNYDTERNALANECRKVESERKAGTICTSDIDDCNDKSV